MYPENGDFEEGIQASIRQLVVAYRMPLDDLTNSIINKLAREQAEKIKRRTKRGGIPSSLVILLNLRQKKQAIAWIKEMTISTACLSNLILNCNKIGFTHRRIHKEFIHEDFNRPVEDAQISSVSKTGEVRLAEKEKILRKLTSRYLNRKYSTAHLFEKGDEWHLIYFDHNDIYAPIGLNHHTRGPHVHYISHLWGRHIDKETLWNQFESREIKANSEHIRFVEKKFIEPKKEKGKVGLVRIKPQSVMKLDDNTVCYKDEFDELKIYRKKKNQD